MSLLCAKCGEYRVEEIGSDESHNNDGTVKTAVKHCECQACGSKGTSYVLSDGTTQETGCLTTEVTA